MSLLKELLVAPLVSAGLRLRVRLPGAVNGSFPQLGATCSGSRYVINRPQILLDLMTDLLAGVGTQVLRVQGTEGAALALEMIEDEADDPLLPLLFSCVLAAGTNARHHRELQ